MPYLEHSTWSERVLGLGGHKIVQLAKSGERSGGFLLGWGKHE